MGAPRSQLPDGGLNEDDEGVEGTGKKKGAASSSPSQSREAAAPTLPVRLVSLALSTHLMSDFFPR